MKTIVSITVVDDNNIRLTLDTEHELRVSAGCIDACELASVVSNVSYDAARWIYDGAVTILKERK